MLRLVGRKNYKFPSIYHTDGPSDGQMDASFRVYGPIFILIYTAKVASIRLRKQMVTDGQTDRPIGKWTNRRKHLLIESLCRVEP